jgi:hypothetical protein
MTTPLWVRGRPSPDFLSDPRRQCIGKWELFFEESIEALEACQALCLKCPLFQDCTRWALTHDLEFGIFAGLTPGVRAKIHAGTPYVDWRRGWKQRQRRTPKGKRTKGQAEKPPCVHCGCQDKIVRYGRSRESNRQRYLCRICRKTFLGEEL